MMMLVIKIAELILCYCLRDYEHIARRVRTLKLFRYILSLGNHQFWSKNLTYQYFKLIQVNVNQLKTRNESSKSKPTTKKK